MKTKTILVLGLAVAIGLAVAGWIIFKQPSPPETARVNAERVAAPEQPGNPTPPAVTPAPNRDSSPVEQANNISGARRHRRRRRRTPHRKLRPNPPRPGNRKSRCRTRTRVALSLVGTDPEAERYWIAAINDSSLSAHERQDLIEDLNEDGLSDPKNPGVEDLPLIVSRLQIIEELAPDAMDKVNADAFREAYKDLSNMYARLTQR